MAQYNVYRTSVGLFTAIIGDDAFNFFDNLAAGDIIDASGMELTKGTQLRESGFLEHTYNCMFYGSDLDPENLSVNAYINCTNYLPNTTRIAFSGITDTYANYTIPCLSADNSSIIYNMRYNNGIPGYLNVQSGSISRNGVVNSYTPMTYLIGHTANTGGSGIFANAIKIGFLVINSALSRLIFVKFDFRDQDQGSIQKSEYSKTKYTSQTDVYPILLWLNSQKPISFAGDDPYAEYFDPAEPGGADGEADTEGNMDFPALPTLGAVSSGFVTLFLPSLADINNLADYMWSSAFDISTIKKLFANPMDAILGLYVLPVSPAITGSKQVSVAGIPISGYTWNYTAQEYISVDCGSITIPKETGSYADYSPMTKLQIWLPYIGFRDIDADDCMGKTLTLRYNIHVLSGACVAQLKCDNTILYAWSGQCSMQIPVTGSDFRSVISSALSLVGTAVGMAIGTPAAASAVAGAISVGQNAINAKPAINRGGTTSGAGGFLANQTPYIVRSNPVLCVPEGQNVFIGYPSFITKQLSDLTGYNEVFSIHLENITATDAEINEIETILKSGVIY